MFPMCGVEVSSYQVGDVSGEYEAEVKVRGAPTFQPLVDEVIPDYELVWFGLLDVFV